MSVRRRTAALVAASLTLALAFGGIAAAGSSSEPVSKKVFLNTADEICQNGNDQLDEAGSIVFGANPPGTDPTPEQIAEFVNTYVIPIISSELDTIETIKVKSKSLRKQVKKLIANGRAELDELASDPQLVASGGNPLPGTARLAKKLGLKVCGT